MATVEIEFTDDSAPQQRKSTPINKLYDTNPNHIPEQNGQHQIYTEKKPTFYEYDFDDLYNSDNSSDSENDLAKILTHCRVEDWSRSFTLFGDFLRDAKKYYKKTCLNAKFIYFFSYRPMYRELNHEQLCWYLFWRSKIRDGEYIKTGLSYIFLYMYEQINLSDIISHEKVYTNIIRVWRNYRAEFPRMDKYAAEWLIDFAFINKIKINLNDIEDILPGILNLVTIPEIYMKEDFFKSQNNTAMIMNNISAYDYTKSKFYTDKNKELLDYHIHQIAHTVLSSDNFNEIVRKEIEDGVTVKATRESFMGAVCVYDYKKKITVEYKHLFRNHFIRVCVTDTVRYAENMIRDYLGIKSKLIVNSLPETLKSTIEEYKAKYLTVAKPAKISIKNTNKAKNKKKNADNDTETEQEIFEPIEFNPNLQTAAEIEKSSWDTTLTLVELQAQDLRVQDLQVKYNETNSALTSFADEDDGGFIKIDTGDPEDYTAVEEIAPAKDDTEDTEDIEKTDNTEDIFDILENLESSNANSINNTETDMCRFIASLTGDELCAVEMLINVEMSGKSFDSISGDFLSSTGAMLESVIDIINEKALDSTGDIVFDAATQEMIEDYKEEIKECLKKLEK